MCLAYFEAFFAGKFWSLRHFGHLYYSNIKTRRNTIYWSIFLTELTYFFRSLKKIRFMAEKN